MILRSLTLENFGLYLGETKLDLVPRRGADGETPIVLIGGKNGAGKTTILEAVRLALYGKRSLGPRVAQSDYEKYLGKRVSRDATVPAAAVSLEFDYAEAGVVHRYSVRRDWSVRGKTVVETLALDKDGIPISSVPREEWHHFLQELIPPGLSNLFFFDGEKIQEIAEGTGEDDHLADAVRGLLGVEIVMRLRTDLAMYIGRRQSGSDSDMAGLIEANVRDITVAERRVDELVEQQAELMTQRNSQARMSEQIRRRFVAEGGDAALARARIESELAEAKRQVARVDTEFRDHSNRLLPFTFAPKLLARMREALGRSAAGHADLGALEVLRSELQKWPGLQAGWTAEHWQDLESFAKEKADQVVDKKPFGVTDPRAMVESLKAIDSVARRQAAQLLNDLEDHNSVVDALSKSLERANSASAGVMLDDLQAIDKQVGATETLLAVKQEEVKSARFVVLTLKREQTKLFEEQARSEQVARQADLAVRTAKALLEYEVRLLELKLKQLETQFVRCFNDLARKSNLVSLVKIDPSTFAVTLYGPDGREVLRDGLSAGEKQIYATAMLWALARTSGRQLPMIIDTPLGRLDREHRSRLLERYFPDASHQVILLSTDTEIDHDVYATLKDHVSHAYRLEFDGSENRTVVVPGYFQSMEGSAERALQQA